MRNQNLLVTLELFLFLFEGI